MTVTPNNVQDLFSNIRFLIQCGFSTIVPAVDFFSVGWTEQGFETLKQQMKRVVEFLNSIAHFHLRVIGKTVPKLWQNCANSFSLQLFPAAHVST